MAAGDLGALVGPLGLQTLAALAIGLGLLWNYRWIRQRSRLAAGIFAAGLLLRAGLGVALFWISYLDLPLFSSLHRGNGFWRLAPDAANYMRLASFAAAEGLDAVTTVLPSPAYVKTMALWMRLVGVSPVSGMYLNVVVYALLCWLLVRLWRPEGGWRSDLPLLVLLAAFSFSPVQVLHGSQILKDDVFALVVTIGAVSAFFVLTAVIHGWRAVPTRWTVPAALLAWLSAVFYAAGIRAYFAFFMLCSLAVTFAVASLRWRWDTLYRLVPAAAAICVLTAAAYLAGAGHYDRYLIQGVRLVLPAEPAAGGEGVIVQVFRRIDNARAGFERSAGGTNIASVEADPLVIPSPDLEPAGAGRGRGRPPLPFEAFLLNVAVGLATLFVPISLLQALSITELTGGRGLLVVTDIDTLFVDVTILLTAVLVYLRWDIVRRRLPFVCYLATLGGATTILLAYVVTNFGTQFRLRMLAVVPFWLLLLATAERISGAPAPPELHVSPRARPGTPG